MLSANGMVRSKTARQLIGVGPMIGPMAQILTAANPRAISVL